MRGKIENTRQDKTEYYRNKWQQQCINNQHINIIVDMGIGDVHYIFFEIYRYKNIVSNVEPS